jgi:hypothetical protein
VETRDLEIAENLVNTERLSFMSISDPDEESSSVNMMKMDGNFCVRSGELKNVTMKCTSVD